VLEENGLLQVLGKDGKPEIYETDEIRIVGIPYLGYLERDALDQVHTLLNGRLPKPTMLLCHIGIAEVMPTLGTGMAAHELDFLRPLVNYVATGHYHRRWSNGWIYCPGCLEPTSIAEKPGGFYLWDTKEPKKNADFVRLDQYYQPRPVYDTRHPTLTHLQDYLKTHTQPLRSPIWRVTFTQEIPTRDAVLVAFGDKPPLKLLGPYYDRPAEEIAIEVTAGKRTRMEIEIDVFNQLTEHSRLAREVMAMALAREEPDVILAALEVDGG
jgi:hypothetical protein